MLEASTVILHQDTGASPRCRRSHQDARARSCTHSTSLEPMATPCSSVTYHVMVLSSRSLVFPLVPVLFFTFLLASRYSDRFQYLTFVSEGGIGSPALCCGTSIFVTVGVPANRGAFLMASSSPLYESLCGIVSKVSFICVRCVGHLLKDFEGGLCC